jgi:hypothetical protein
MKSYASENDLFLFSALWIVTRKTGNTGAEKLYGRANIPSYSIHALYKPLHGDLMKSYAIAKTNIIASDNIFVVCFLDVMYFVVCPKRDVMYFVVCPKRDVNTWIISTSSVGVSD